MLRLLRTVFGLFATNTVCVALIILINWSDTTWGCLQYRDGIGKKALLDLKSGYLVANRPIPDGFDGLGGYFGNLLIYNYFSPADSQTRIHRIGVVTNKKNYAHAYLDAPDSTSYALQLWPSPDAQFVPVLWADYEKQMQTLVMYESDTLTPIAKVIQQAIEVPEIILDAYQIYRTSWSPSGAWFMFPARTSNGLTVTAISSSLGHSFSLPLSGLLDDLEYLWSTTERAIAISSSNGHFVDIFLTDTEDWKQVQHYQFDAGDKHDQFALLQWSVDGNLLFMRKTLYTTPTPQIKTLVFRLDTRDLYPSNDGQSISIPVHGDWICDDEAGKDQVALISVSSKYPPIKLAKFNDLSDSPCSYLHAAPNKAQLIVPTYLGTQNSIVWVNITFDPFSLTPMTLPTTTRRIVLWSEDSQTAIFFMHDTQRNTDEMVGQIGILNSITQRWKTIQAEVAIDSLSVSPDSSRFTIYAADRHYLLLFSMDGYLIATLPTNGSQVEQLHWSPDGSRFIVIDSSAFNTTDTMLSAYDRDGQPILNISHSSALIGASIDNWSHCDPIPQFPRMNLPQ